MSLKRPGIALLDRIEINGFTVTDIDSGCVDRLVATGVVTIKGGLQRALKTESGYDYHEIKIGKTTHFDSFYYGLSDRGYIYARMELSVPDDGYHNLNGYTIEEYQKRIRAAQDYLDITFGIKAEFSECQLTYVEIGETIILDEDPTEYVRPVKLIMSILPRQLRLILTATYMDNDNTVAGTERNLFGTILRHNNSKTLEIKIYNKKRQLEKLLGKCIPGNYLRFEVSLSTSQKIKSCIKTAKVMELQSSDITFYMESFVQHNILRTYAESIKRSKRQMEKTIKAHYQKGSHSWIHDVVNEIKNQEIRDGTPTVLSLTEILDGLKRIKCDRICRHKYKIRFQRACSNCDMDVFLQSDLKKVEEILRKLSSHFTSLDSIKCIRKK